MIKELSAKQMLNIFLISCNDLNNIKNVINAQENILVHFIYEIQERRIENQKYFNYEYIKIIITVEKKWFELCDLLTNYFGQPIIHKQGFKNILKSGFPYMYNYYLAYVG